MRTDGADEVALILQRILDLYRRRAACADNRVENVDHTLRIVNPDGPDQDACHFGLIRLSCSYDDPSRQPLSGGNSRNHDPSACGRWR